MNENDLDESMRPVIIQIIDLYIQFMAKDITFPLWQREDKWSKSFKQGLIQSIIGRRMIPMLFFAELEGHTYILDGGHRTRAICGFINNEYMVPLQRDGWIDMVYYNQPEKSSLTTEERANFDNFPLPLYKYTHIDEDECREIFNDLQHFRSMTTAEVCNSRASYLIEYLRGFKDFQVEGNTCLVELLESRSNPFPSPKCHGYLLVLLQLMSFFDGDSCESSLTDCKGGKDTIDYVKKFRQDEMTDSYKGEFVATLNTFFTFVSSANYHKVTTLYSLYHYMVWHRINDIGAFLTRLDIGLLTQVNEYGKKMKLIQTLQKQGHDQHVVDLRETLSEGNDDVKEWYETTVMRGNSYNTGRHIRLKLLKRLFPYEEIATPMDDVVQEMNVVAAV